MKFNKKAIGYSLAGIIFIVYALVFHSPFKKEAPYVHNEGKAQGTYYSATYQQPDGKDLQPEIDKFFKEFDLSLSTYNPESVISRINKNDASVSTDSCFEAMFYEALKVSEKTGGAFDITVAPLVEAWGFGASIADTTHLPDINKILPLVGYKKVKIVNHKLIKENPDIKVDASAIAQGLSADLIARLLESYGCKNYMIDIGGEIFCKGVNPKGKNWQIGVDKPVDDPENTNGELQTIINVSNVGLTTSGNYRKFYYKGGKKYAHTIDPHTGYPVQHNLLSATVVAPTAMQADAYATAFMVMGVDKAMALCKTFNDMDCYLVYTDNDGKYQVTYTKGFEKYINK
ncbi:MAG: ApbE family lipoprotein [Bacteroidetes bacterium]|jgi:thiamine biosynthesis lipoprotein|nr:ApbE family lipoprotein [Bacteroidota bacterium]